MAIDYKILRYEVNIIVNIYRYVLHIDWIRHDSRSDAISLFNNQIKLKM